MDIEREFENYKEFGYKLLENGTKLIGRAPFIAPMAYLHSLYHPHTNAADIIEKELDIELPNVLKEFYIFYNGLNFFVGTFFLYGLRETAARSLDAVRQPFDIFTPNVKSRLKGAGKNVLFIGGYSWNGSKLYIDIQTEKVFMCSKRSIVPLYEWNDFGAMLFSEIKRLKKLHTHDGKNIPYRPTVPVGGEDALERRINDKWETIPYWYEETIEFMKKNNLTARELAEI